MAHTIPVKYMYGGSDATIQIHSDYPIYSSSSGSLINVLDKCLINGFGQKTISLLTIDTNGIATITSNSHGYNKLPVVILIEGADQENINGEWEITAYTTNTLTFNASDSGLVNTIITGATITMKIAPLGWEKPFEDVVNYFAVYRSKHPYSRRHLLRVDDADSPATSATTRMSYFRGYEIMSDASDNGIRPFPLKTSFGRGLNINKTINTTAGIYLTTSAANISWFIIGTSRQFYLAYHYFGGNDARYKSLMFFGDLVSYVPGDIGSTGLCASNSVSNTSCYGLRQPFEDAKSYSARNCTRLWSTTDTKFKLGGLSNIASSTQPQVFGQNSATYYPTTEPDVYSNKTIIARPYFIFDTDVPSTIRGEMPGLAQALNNLAGMSTNYTTYSIITNTNTNERFVYVPQYLYSGLFGYVLFSIDRDWNIPIL